MGTSTRPLTLILGIVAVAARLPAQTEDDFELRILPAAVGPVCSTGGTVDLSVVLAHPEHEVRGWSLGLVLEPDPGVVASIREIEISSEVLTSHNGRPPDFLVTRYYGAHSSQVEVSRCDSDNPDFCQGIEAVALNQGVLIAHGGEVALPPTESTTIMELKVFAAAPDLGEGETAHVRVAFSDTTGDPHIAVTIVTSGSLSFEPTVQAPVVITVGEPSCPVTGQVFDMRILPAGTERLDYRGETVDVTVTLATRVDGVQGWGFGLGFECDPGVEASMTSIRPGEDLLTVQDGAPPDFLETSFYAAGNLEEAAGDCDPGDPASCEGISAAAVTQEVVLDISEEVSLAATPDLSVLDLSVFVAAPGIDPREVAEARLAFTDALGTPPVGTAVTIGRETIQPDLRAPAVIRLTRPQDVLPRPQDLDMAVLPADAGSVPSSGGTVNLLVAVTTRIDGAQGWSFGVVVEPDPGVDAWITGIRLTDDLLTVNKGSPPQDTVTYYYEDDLRDRAGGCGPDDPTGCEDIQANALIHMSTFATPPRETIPATEDFPVLELEVFAAAPGLEAGETREVRLALSDEIGDPRVDVMVMYSGISFRPGVLAPAAITVAGVQAVTFLPGSANADGRLDIADGIYILNYLFAGGPPLPCELAGDANGDCVLDSSDAVYVIMHQFLGGPPPAGGSGCQAVAPDMCPGLTCENAVEPGC